jgi:hypothetical protein
LDRSKTCKQFQGEDPLAHFLVDQANRMPHAFEIAKSASNIRVSFMCKGFIDDIDAAYNYTFRYDEKKARASSEFTEV